MMKKHALLLMPSIMNLYKDIIEELEKLNFDVTYVEDYEYHNWSLERLHDFIRINIDKKFEKSKRNNYINFWHNLNKKNIFNQKYDILLSIDGFASCDYLIDSLEKENPGIKKILYLFDPISKNRQFDTIFKYYDNIYTFDIEDSQKYNIGLLPIYWKSSPKEGEHYNIFGYASFGNGYSRYNVFSSIKEQAEKLGLKYLIKLYTEKVNDTELKALYKKLFNRNLSLKVNQNIITHDPIMLDEYRGLINSADIILDAQGQPQAGMTTRFSWAIGAGKKIITDNPFVKKYPFYDKSLIYVVSKDNGYMISQDFLMSKVRISEAINNEILKFRIDNWLNTLIN